ncbi:MAG TPA: hypothetical protein VGK67_21660 [Myxococcales bacterium]|jgi:hypothetical protein
MTLRTLFPVAACVALLGLTACPSTCQRGCNQMDFCGDKFGASVDVPQCIDNCSTSTTCTNQEEVYGCYADMTCSNGLSYALEFASCAALCKT